MSVCAAPDSPAEPEDAAPQPPSESEAAPMPSSSRATLQQASGRAPAAVALHAGDAAAPPSPPPPPPLPPSPPMSAESMDIPSDDDLDDTAAQQPQVRPQEMLHCIPRSGYPGPSSTNQPLPCCVPWPDIAGCSPLGRLFPCQGRVCTGGRLQAYPSCQSLPQGKLISRGRVAGSRSAAGAPPDPSLARQPRHPPAAAPALALAARP